MGVDALYADLVADNVPSCRLFKERMAYEPLRCYSVAV